MDSNKGRYSIEMMAKILKISPRSYYDHRQNKYMIRSNKRDYLSTQIQEYYFLTKGRNGSPRLAMDLKAAGIKVSRTIIATYMRVLIS